MVDNVTRFLAGLSASRDRTALTPILRAIADRFSSQMFTTGGLTIFTGGASPLAMAATLCHGVVQGAPFSIAANTNMAALSGTIAQNTFNLYVFYIDVNAVLTSAMGTAGAAITSMRFPPMPEGKTMIGYVRLNPTSAAFIGGTTNLDAASTNAVYVNTLGAVDPTLLVG